MEAGAGVLPADQKKAIPEMRVKRRQAFEGF